MSHCRARVALDRVWTLHSECGGEAHWGHWGAASQRSARSHAAAAAGPPLRDATNNPSHDVALFPEKWRDIADGKKARVASLATLTLVLFIASTLQKVSIAGVSLVTVQAPGSCPPMVEITLPQLHTITTSSSTRDRNEGSRIFHAVNASCKCSTRTFSCLKFPTRVV